MADYSTSTRLFVGQELLQAPPGDKFLRAVQRAVGADFDVLGELGRGGNGKIVYLARERSTRHLVALQLVPGPGGVESGELWLDVLRKLDASVPSVEGSCPRCNQKLQGWGRFCSQCGADLSGVAPDSGANTSADRLFEAVRQAAGDRYEVLGQMDRSEGGGVVYFAREKAGGAIVALRLQKDAPAADGRERYNLGQTAVLKSMVSSMLGPDQPPPAPPKPPPPPKAAQPPAPAKPAAATQPRRAAKYWAGAVLLLLAVILVWGLRSRSATVVEASTDTVATITVDSAELQLGGDLPAGAVITVDGQTVSPAGLRLAPGTYRVKVAAPSFTPVEQELTLRPGQTLLWSPHLTRAVTRPPRPSPRPDPPEPRAPSPPPPSPPPPAPLPRPSPDTGRLLINQPPQRPRDSVPRGPIATAAATCASLFSALEWSRALPVCEREAGQGGTAAQRTLGTMYERGLATEADPKTASLWYGKAAQSGDRIAQYRFGVLLRSGKGVKKDEKAAFKWFQRSADQGEADAQLALAQAYDRGQGVKRSRTTSAKWYLKAAEAGKAEAQFRLGEFYQDGEAGLPESEAEARKWFKLAADQGHEEARDKLD